jgi:hypothetical protein
VSVAKESVRVGEGESEPTCVQVRLLGASARAQAVFYGLMLTHDCDWTRRFLLPIPFRTNVTLLFGAPIAVEKRENPSEAEVDAVHQQMLDAFVKLFDTHKAALGWSHRSLKII